MADTYVQLNTNWLIVATHLFGPTNNYSIFIKSNENIKFK